MVRGLKRTLEVCVGDDGDDHFGRRCHHGDACARGGRREHMDDRVGKRPADIDGERRDDSRWSDQIDGNAFPLRCVGAGI